ncbi:MAG: adenylyltransferase/cytidyltransferase family protein [bacterium]|nr:adenylyltransferase/cytidyltransferase family protein [bacterium]
MRDKIYERRALAARLTELRAAGLCKLVFTNGCFDLVHVGHLRYLWAARRQGDALVVAVNDDDSIRRLKGPDRPILKLEERLQILAGFACVDFVTWFGEDTPIPLLCELRPEVLVKGANYSIDGVVGREVAEGWGAEVKTLALTPGRSTTGLIEKVLALKTR